MIEGTLELINNTLLIILDKIEPSVVIYAMAAFIQPRGSVKDRVVYQTIRDAHASGKLKMGSLFSR